MIWRRFNYQPAGGIELYDSNLFNQKLILCWSYLKHLAQLNLTACLNFVVPNVTNTIHIPKKSRGQNLPCWSSTLPNPELKYALNGDLFGDNLLAKNEQNSIAFHEIPCLPFRFFIFFLSPSLSLDFPSFFVLSTPCMCIKV